MLVASTSHQTKDPVLQKTSALNDNDKVTSTSILSIPDEDINFDLVYALHNFVATVEGQVSVVKGDALILVDDSNAYWWLIKVLKSSQVGYLPAENIETPFERLSRLNKHKNAEMVGIDSHPTPWLPKHQQKKVRLSGTVRVQSHWTCEEEGVWRDTYTEHEKPLPPMAQDHWVRESTLSAHSPKNDEKEKKKTDVFWRLFSRGKGDRNSIDDREQFMQPILKEEKEKEEELSSVLRVYAGNLHVGVTYNSVLVTKNMCAEEMLMQAMERFHISQIEAKAMRKLSTSGVEYYLSLASVDHEEIILSPEDKPLAMFKSLTNHFTTPMPSLHHFKQCSHHLNAADFSPNRTSSRQKTKKQEECSIRFYLHKRIRSVNEREEQLHVKITYLPSRMSKRIGLEVCPERIDKIIAMPKKATVHECIRIACNKFHLTLGNEETFQRQEMPCFTLTEADKEQPLCNTAILAETLQEKPHPLPRLILQSNPWLKTHPSKRTLTHVPLTAEIEIILQKLTSALAASSSETPPCTVWMAVARSGEDSVDIIMPHGVLRSTSLPQHQVQYTLMASTPTHALGIILRKVVQLGHPPSKILDTLPSNALAALVKHGTLYLQTQ